MTYTAELYMHELDRKAFAALNRFPMFIKLQKAYISNGIEKAEKINLLSTSIRLSENQRPEIYQLLPPICEKLGVSVPDLYMVQSDVLNAQTGGVTEPYICITTELAHQLPADMISSVLAHECGHIACKHILYHSLARSFINGIENSPLSRIPEIRNNLSEAMVRALLFWYRCSELSADRAAVLCDGSSEKTVDVLLKINGFDESTDRTEFIKQALDLKNLINDSRSNQMIEQMVVQWESHPLLATRAYECYDWEQSQRYKDLIHGTYPVNADKSDLEKNDVINAEVSAEEGKATNENMLPEVQEALERRLQQVNQELEKCTNQANRYQYALSIAIGIISGVIDSLLFSNLTVSDNSITLLNAQANPLIQKYADFLGTGKDWIGEDNIRKAAGIGVSALNHRLADSAHHPTPLGLISAIAVKIFRVGTVGNKNGNWNLRFIKTDKKDILSIAIAAVITGVLNWLVNIAHNESECGNETPQAIQSLAPVIASTPEIMEIVKRADHWFDRLVSDMGKSKKTASDDMGGIPEVFLSLFLEISSLPGIKDSNLPDCVNKLCANKKVDQRHKLMYTEPFKTQAIPVIFNEVFTRLGYMILQLETELTEHNGFEGVNWQNVIPLDNRSVDRCLTISTMTFTFVDTIDTAVRDLAALESGAYWVIFSGNFRARYNFVGTGRAALAIIKEVSYESRESQLIHEKMLLMDAKAQIMYQQLQQFKEQLEEKITCYLAEDIEAFIEGFNYMKEGFVSGDSNLVIKGNVVIQKVLGREPQFTTQEEFDDFMESDIPLQF